ncbi:DUF6300 family protein [Kitasatospora camelliae]|uniref:DUF6300 family protein n=1 Tax=Kitasatospora camelliae TaxID=3156397 RepID=A0AAU8K4F7_9ACTN
MSVRVERCDRVGACATCESDLLLVTQIPVGDGRRVPLALCGTCDAERGAAGQLVALLNVPAEQRDVAAIGDSMVAWMREEMAARGWVHVPRPKPSLN